MNGLRSNRRARRGIASCVAAACVLGLGGHASGQAFNASRADVAFNRYYTHAELNGHVRRIAEAYPELVSLTTIGQSGQGRDLIVATVKAPGSDDLDRPAMWIDGNIHGNEIQASEVVLYTLWYLTKEYGHNDDITDLLDRVSFYLLVSVNPDGRENWFENVNNSSTSRHNRADDDDDRDGLVNEDGPEDLDGDGSITRMWVRDPNGQFVRSRWDDRVFERVPPGERGEWTSVGWEGIDNDGDGRVNEDGDDGFDMNRNWGSDWQPNYVQFGAGDYPFSVPETIAVRDFVLARPNIAAFQSYHNSGGMILRGPGAAYLNDAYAPDLGVYREIQEVGVQMLPYYRALVTYQDLYQVHGGESHWASESLGIIGFTNEMWTGAKYFQGDVTRPNEEQMTLFRDRLQFGADFTPYTEVEHPQYGTVLVGGPNKWSSRNTPTFMLEEECHRNAAFTLYHASCMADVSFDRVEVEGLGDGMWQVTVEIRNEQPIPTRTGRQAARNIGRADLLTCEVPRGRVVASGRLDNWREPGLRETRFEPGRVLLPSGVPGRGSIIHRFFIEAPEGTTVTLRFDAERANDLETSVRLGPVGQPPRNR
ncbi:MAG: M14 family metallopeptidase [Phycisphaerales bacterium]